MDSNQYLDFFYTIKDDPRIRITHIAVFAAIYFLWIKSGCQSELKVFSEQVMVVAKISSRITYCRVIIDLGEFGYINYCPSFFAGKPSTITLIIGKHKDQGK